MYIDTAKMAASNIDWTSFIEGVPVGERVTYDLRPHQERAVAAIEEKWAEFDRCKAIMACDEFWDLFACSCRIPVWRISALTRNSVADATS